MMPKPTLAVVRFDLPDPDEGALLEMAIRDYVGTEAWQVVDVTGAPRFW